MDLRYGSKAREPLVTNVGLITSNGPWGHNVMASEWTSQISYDPGLIAISIGPGKATHENIAASMCFGVGIAGDDQNVLCSIAGNNHGKEVDKVAALTELGFRFQPAKHIDVLMVEGAALQVECELIATHDAGDHTLFIGRALSVLLHEEKRTLIYHLGRYWNVGPELKKPSTEEREHMKSVMEKHRR